MNKKPWPTKIQEYLLKVAGPSTAPLCEIAEKMLSVNAREAMALKAYLTAVKARDPKLGEKAAELYLANDAAFKAFAECEEIAKRALGGPV